MTKLYDQISVSSVKQLRNRKHVPCFYRVIETRVEVWENEKCCGNKSCRQEFPQLFQVLPNFHECFYNSIETQRTCFLLEFLLENTMTKKQETTSSLWSSKCKFSLLTPSLCQQLTLVLCFYHVVETQFFKQSAHIFSEGCFLIVKSTQYTTTAIKVNGTCITIMNM